jgi:uncharacterized membrane protein YkvA (DUF1232 family)
MRGFVHLAGSILSNGGTDNMRITRGLGLGSIMRLRHLPAYLKDPSISLLKKVAIAAALLYVISPADALPDVIPIVGWLDDMGVLGILITSLMRELDGYGGEPQRQLAD